MNGYFQLIGKTEGTYLKLIPPTDGGKAISINDINEYLNMVRVYEYDIKEVNAAIQDLKEETTIKLNDDALLPTSEQIAISISQDKMQAIIRFYPPSDKGKNVEYDEIVSTLTLKGVKVGVEREVIEKILAVKQYCCNYVVAKGIPVTLGQDAVITYHFNTNLTVKPKMNQDGTVDFHRLDNIGHIHKGQVLATLTPEDPGKPGLNVLGEIIRQPNYNKLKLRFGKNIELSEDKCTITSTVDGHASLVEGKVFVSNVYEVANVDTSTGNISFEGDVIVKGNVLSGFEIVAKGNIQVHGVVEGAVLIAGGNIVVERGIQGRHHGILKAGGNVITKFIESAHVEAEGFVQTESILHSKVSAKGEIVVQGKKGFIAGGSVISLVGVTARTIGSPMGADTKVEVGIDPALKERQQTLLKEIDETRKKINVIEPIITNYMKKVSQGQRLTKEQTAYIKQISDEYKELRKQLDDSQAEIDDMNATFEMASNARIKVLERVYADVKLTISDCALYVRDERDHCQFVREQGEVKMLML